MRTLILVPSLIAVPVLALAAIEPTVAPVAVMQPVALAAQAAQPAAAAMTLDPVHSMALFRIQHLEAGQFRSSASSTWRRGSSGVASTASRVP
ncbi:MAG: hypothetical protein RLZZ217_2196 [Planctomycetota bacterium]